MRPEGGNPSVTALQRKLSFYKGACPYRPFGPPPPEGEALRAATQGRPYGEGTTLQLPAAEWATARVAPTALTREAISRFR